MEHVRSHQADSSEMLRSDLPQEEVVAISGNKAADEAATEALGMHPAFSEEPLAVSKKQFMMAKNVLLLAAKALPEWGAGKRGGKKLYREEVLAHKSKRAHLKAGQEAPLQQLLTADGGHFWLPFGAKGHRCAFCPVRATHTKQKLKRSTEFCARDLGQLGQVLARVDETQHHLHWAVHHRAGIRVLACSRCDAYATLSPKLLLEPCVLKKKKPNWERLSQGKFLTNRFGNVACFCKPFLTNIGIPPRGCGSPTARQGGHLADLDQSGAQQP